MARNETGVRWLQSEIPELIRLGVIDQAAALRLLGYYGPPAPSRARRIVLTVFGILGALLVGGGIILLFAHNWDDLPRPVRAALSIGQLLAAQWLALGVLWKRPQSAPWREGAACLVAAGVLSSIALVSQTYQIPGSMADYLLTCAVLVLPVIYLLESRAAAILFWLGIAYWTGWAREEARPSWVFWLLAAAALPFLIRMIWKRQEWRPIGFFAAVALVFGGAFLTAGIPGPGWWILYFAGLFAFFSALEVFSDFDLRLRFVSWLGLCGLAVIWLLTTFEWPWDPGRIQSITPDGGSWLTLLIGMALGLAALGALPAVWRKRSRGGAMACAALIPTALAWGMAHPGGHLTAQFLSNLFLAGLGVGTFLDGVFTSRLGKANLGLVMISGLALARFLDSDLSFVTRGVGFIVVGLIFLAANLYLVRRKETGP